MPRSDIPNTSLGANSPINTINRRQRSNTSPTPSISALNCAPMNVATLPNPPLATPDRYVEHPPLRCEAARQDDQKHERPSLVGTGSNPTNSLSYPASHHTRSLKREANSPVYLDSTSISLASSNNNSYLLGYNNINYAARRVVHCNPHRIRSSDSDVTSISSQDENFNFQPSPNTDNRNVSIKSRKKAHGQRNKWTSEETQALVRGCNNFAIGQWKAIRDSEPVLSNRSPGDLKDRFRTYFPDAYRKHYPNAKTHISSRVRSVDSNGNPLFGENAVRRERKQFSAEEDAALKRGYVKFGTAWSSIQRDPILASRKATDLRDRFRNAFPEIYAAAGYKPRSRKASGSNVLDFLAEPSQQHGTFEAIDLCIYPPHPSRGISHWHPNDYELPSLDFLKAHGAEAFSDFSMMLSTPQMAVGEDVGPLDRPQRPATTLSPAIPVHVTNITPRPSITTPRPNDTTPRPQNTMIITTDEVFETISVDSREKVFLVSVPTKPPKSVHKTQSSMDLTEFSNLHLVDSSFNPPKISHDMHTDMYAPTSTDYLEYGAASIQHCPEKQFFQRLTCKPSRGPESHQEEQLQITGSPIQGQFDRYNRVGTTMNDPTDWLHEIDVASQTFPGTFDLSRFANEKVFESADGGSCSSPLISSDHSNDLLDDRVIYTGYGNNFHQSTSAHHSVTSQQSTSPHQSQLQSMPVPPPQPQELFPNGFLIEHNSHATRELPNNIDLPRFSAAQLEQQCHIYQHHHGQVLNEKHFNEITLCPSVLVPDLNSPLACPPASPVSASSAINPSSSTSSLSLVSSSPTNQSDLLNT